MTGSVPGANASGAAERSHPSAAPAAVDDAGWAAAARAALAAADAQLAQRFDAYADIDRLLADRAAAVDAQVLAAWQRCIPADAGMALFAVGGYGRAGCSRSPTSTCS
jgi:[protein-PII] uridylyltransferase